MNKLLNGLLGIGSVLQWSGGSELLFIVTVDISYWEIRYKETQNDYVESQNNQNETQNDCKRFKMTTKRQYTTTKRCKMATGRQNNQNRHKNYKNTQNDSCLVILIPEKVTMVLEVCIQQYNIMFEKWG